MRAFALAVSTAAALVSCVGVSGGRTFEFESAAAGPEDVRGHTLRFTTARGYDVELTRAVLHVGAIYMNEFLPVANAQADDCTSSGRYTAQVTRGRDIDLLDATPQAFPLPGVATSTVARAGEIWLTGGDVYDENDDSPVFATSGTARRGEEVIPFEALFTIGASRKRPPPSAAQPGANPLCRERIVSPIPLGFVPQEGGSLLVRVDPRKLFVAIAFDELTPAPGIGGGADPSARRVFRNDSSDAPSAALYGALRSAPLYAFEWRPAP